ncbi:MAG: sulfatase [Acidobacteriota bacterium]
MVILFADDLGYGDLSSYGHPTLRTPHLDRLAADGQRWTSFYSPSPVCSPSRGALLTGRHGVRTGLYGQRLGVLFPNDPTGLPDEEVTLAELLREKGYRTAAVGKWHLGEQPPSFPTRHGFERWFGLPYSNDMDWLHGFSFEETLQAVVEERVDDLAADRQLKGEAYAEPKLEYWNVPLWRSTLTEEGAADELVERPTDQTTLTRRYTEEALDFIDASSGEAPFFLYLAYTMPHTPLFRSEEFVGSSRAGTYGDVVEEIDWSVGQLVQRIEELGLGDDTLIVFTSDNGPWLTMLQNGGSAGPLRDGKGTTFEGGMRVPAIFSWPGRIAAGQTVSELGTALDLYATVAAVAGIELPGDRTFDSVDLGPVLFDGGSSLRKSFAYYRSGELYAWRSGPWKIHRVTEGAYSMPPARTEHEIPLLHHLEHDPAERFDVAAQHPDVVRRLQQEVDEHLASFEPATPLFDLRLQAAVP